MDKKESDHNYYLKHREELIEYQKEYVALHKELVSERRRIYRECHKKEIKEYREAHKEETKAVMKKYRQVNKERINEVSAKWRRANPEKVKAYNSAAKARRRKVGGYISHSLVKEIQEMFNGRCPYCNKIIVQGHLDHVKIGRAHV